MRVLVLAGLIRSIAATTGPVFLGIGKPKIDTKLQAVRLFVLAVLIYPLTMQWGIIGTSLAVLISILVTTIGFSYLVIRIINCDWKHFLQKIIVPLVNTVIMVLIIFFLKIFFTIRVGEFFLLIIVAILIYLGLTYFSDKFLKYKTQSIIKECWNLLIT